jgi:hypothetical protein
LGAPLLGFRKMTMAFCLLSGNQEAARQQKIPRISDTLLV